MLLALLPAESNHPSREGEGLSRRYFVSSVEDKQTGRRAMMMMMIECAVVKKAEKNKSCLMLAPL